jgi:branched-chain amino acid transport system permease protein
MSRVAGKFIARSWAFWLGMTGVAPAAFALTLLTGNEYPFFAGFTILQFVALASAWNILGGYAGYVNFGTSAFVGIGIYVAVFLFKWISAPLAMQIAAAAVVGALLGFGVGALTLRLRGIFFSIATLAVTIIVETCVAHWTYVGGPSGIQLQRPAITYPFDSYIKLLFVVEALIAGLAVAMSRIVEQSWIGRGLQALRDDEVAAEAAGVPTLRLKVLACIISGALMAAAGAPTAMYLQYAQTVTAFDLNYSISTLTMALIGGAGRWSGPVLGAVLLGVAQQWLTVSFSSEVNILLVGLVLVAFVSLAPNGLVGLLSRSGRPNGE